MVEPLVPGVYFEPSRRRIRESTGLVRTDVTAFVGYAPRGPRLLPVVVESYREFSALFGEYPNGFLASAVRGFFENGGLRCYVVRLTDSSAASAHVDLRPSSEENQHTYHFRFVASLPWVRLGRQKSPLAHEASSSQIARPGAPDSLRRLLNPGRWGNRLRLGVAASPILSTRIRKVDAPNRVTWLANTAGLEAGTSLVEMLQGAHSDATLRRFWNVPKRVDHAEQRVEWHEELPHELEASLLEGPVLVQTSEVALRVFLDNELVEEFEHLAIHGLHSRSLLRVLAEQSQLLHAELCLGGVTGTPESHERAASYAPWWREELWSPDGGSVDGFPPIRIPSPAFQLAETLQDPHRFSSGEEGLSGIGTGHFEAGLRQVEQVDEISLVAVPDLVYRKVVQRETILRSLPEEGCAHRLRPIPQGWIWGRVIGAAGEGLADVRVSMPEEGRRTETDEYGRFEFQGIEPDPMRPVHLRFDNVPRGEVSSGSTSETVTRRYIPRSVETRVLRRPPPEAFWSDSPDAPVEAPEFVLEVDDTPPELSLDDILKVQVAMADSSQVGAYRFALLDPPSPDLDAEGLGSYRARLGSLGNAALFYPWLEVPRSEDVQRAAADLQRTEHYVPPSGHVAGLIARIDGEHGVFHAPANRSLRHVDGLSAEVTSAEQAALNPVGVNCLRRFAGRGIVVFGSRTLSDRSEYRYISVRRLLLALKKTLSRSLQWAVFEGNTLLLRQAVVFSIQQLLSALWRKGALRGETPAAAFRIKANEDNNPPAAVDHGEFLAEVAVAPAVPFEFIIFRLGKTLDALEVSD